MDLSKTPKPISYAVAIIIVALGLAGAYRIFLGSAIDIKTPFGDISVPGLDSELSISTFVNEAKSALVAAETKITKQNQVITDLNQQLSASQEQVSKLADAFDKLKQARTAEEKRRSTLALANAAKASQTFLASTQTVIIPKNIQTVQTISKQLKLLNKVDLSSINYTKKKE